MKSTTSLLHPIAIPKAVFSSQPKCIGVIGPEGPENVV